MIEFIVPPLPPHHHDPHHNDPHHDVARPRYHRCQLLIIMLIDHHDLHSHYPHPQDLHHLHQVPPVPVQPQPAHLL